MKTNKNIMRGAVALSVAATGVAVAATSATAGTPPARPAVSGAVAAARPASPAYGDGGYGFITVRSAIPDSVARFSVRSPQIHDGEFPASAWADAFGCSGANRQFTLQWSGAPSGTRSLAVTMFDPDAPSGSGFWHWLVWDIPAGSTGLTGALPPGAVAGTDSAGVTGYLGPCPPAGDVTHHYEITVYALNVPSLGLPSSTPADVTTFSMSSHIIGYARMSVDAKR
jgi:Raf kinase inhibitor-like YbhB/YbcL family protein